VVIIIFMAKLYFRHGTMGSAKTLNLLAVAHSYQQQAKKVLVLKPELDDRFGKDKIRSRSGLEKTADILVKSTTRLTAEELTGLSCILVDEAQFLLPDFVDHLHKITRDRDIPVICYGLRTDFRTCLFEGSRRLFEVADTVEEIKSVCNYCNKKAVFNMKLMGGIPTLTGPKIQLGAEEAYLPVCAKCYHARLSHERSLETFESVQSLTV
jgi:thymidine kinase